MLLIALKLILAPGFVALASLAGRRWGLAVSGWISTFPIVAGPILYFFAVEQGPAFASQAALKTLLGVVGFSFFAWTYAWASRSLSLAWTILLSWTAFLTVGLTLSQVEFSFWIVLSLSLLSLWVARFLMPKQPAKKNSTSAGEYSS